MIADFDDYIIINNNNNNNNKDIYNAQIRRGSKCAVSGQYWREMSSISVYNVRKFSNDTESEVLAVTSDCDCYESIVHQ